MEHQILLNNWHRTVMESRRLYLTFTMEKKGIDI